MIKIGDIAKIFDISIKTMRFYEEKGLIIPKFTDFYSGYRYYDDENIETIGKILYLKDLGFSLKEIKNFTDDDIKSKIKNYEFQIDKLKRNIHILETLSKKESEVITMKPFINDNDAIGKWEFVGVSKSKDDFLNNKLLDSNDEENDISIKELYLMEGGQDYWVISWTSGIIYIGMNKSENPYEIIDDLMFVKFIDPIDKNNYKIVIYKRIDRKKYTIKDIELKDNINIPFVKDDKLIGFWKSIDFVRNPEIFNPNKRYWKTANFSLEKLTVTPEKDVLVTYKNNIKKTTYSKGYIINLCTENTLSKYIYKEINGKIYIIIEWKSGDYIYSKIINGYYVLEKIK
jgi:DNA-binding transcriptional MerR regulator